MPQGVRQRPGPSWTVGLGLLLCLGVVLVELLYRVPPFPSDQLNYMDAARTFPGSDDRPHHQVLRIGLTLPMWGAIQLFGPSQAAYLAIPILAGAALAAGTYVLGCLLCGRAVGCAAALLVVGCSAVFPELTMPLPDLLATALFTHAVALAVAVRRGHPATSAGPRRERIALMAIGALLGWSYLTREFIVFGWPLVPLVLFRRARLRGLFWTALPLAVIGAGEALLSAAVWGDPLARLHVAVGHGEVLDAQPYSSSYQGHPRSWYAGLLTSGLGHLPDGPFLVAAVVGTVAGGLLRPRTLGLLLGWAALFYVPLVLLGGVWDPAQPMLRLIKLRYWYPLLPAVLLGGVAGLWLLARAVARRVPVMQPRAPAVAGTSVALVAALSLTAAQQARATDPAYAANGGTQLEQFRDWLQGSGDRVQTIVADCRTARVLPLFTRGTFGGQFWNGTVVRLPCEEKGTKVAGGAPLNSRAPVVDAAPGDHVVRYSLDSEVCGQCARAGRALFGKDRKVPPSWEQVYGTADGVLEVYRIGPARPKPDRPDPDSVTTSGPLAQAFVARTEATRASPGGSERSGPPAARPTR